MIQRPRVFLDASVLLAAAGSPDGGSSAAIALIIKSDDFEAVVSAAVLRESLGDARRKFRQTAIARYDTLIADLRPHVIEPQSSNEVPNLPSFVAVTDTDVVQGRLASDAAICLTLDRKHVLTEEIRRWGIARHLRFFTPGEFLAWGKFRTRTECPTIIPNTRLSSSSKVARPISGGVESDF